MVSQKNFIFVQDELLLQFQLWYHFFGYDNLVDIRISLIKTLRSNKQHAFKEHAHHVWNLRFFLHCEDCCQFYCMDIAKFIDKSLNGELYKINWRMGSTCIFYAFFRWGVATVITVLDAVKNVCQQVVLITNRGDTYWLRYEWHSE